METVRLIQGNPQWHAHRARHWNASDAPAMLGCSPYMTRTELLHRLHTGIHAEVDPAAQRRFDDGHRFEALARPLAEKIIGEDLYAVTGVKGRYSASFDGLTMLEDTAWEHKTLNDSLRYTPWDEGNGYHLPLHYRVQMEQQLLVSGALRVLFMASKWNGDELEEERHCWYSSDPALRTQIVEGWKQFALDLAAYVPQPVEAPKPTGKAPDTLPALRIEVTGMVTASNLAEFKETALAAIRGVNRELTTDQHFSDAEQSVKWCEEVEARLKAAKEHALSQTASIDQLFKTIDDISAEARKVRLDLDKLVKARKEELRGEIVAAGLTALRRHIEELNAAMPGAYMPQVPADFGGVIKGKRSLASIQDAVDTELARAKIAASEIANRIHVNARAIKESGLVVHDAASLVLKAPDDLAAAIAQRQAAERERQEKGRERIRVEIEAERKVREAAEAMALQRTQIDAQMRTLDQAEDAAIVAAPDTGERINLGQINTRLAPLSITAAGLSELGFEPVETVKASKLYRASDFDRICSALVLHIQSVAALAEPTQAGWSIKQAVAA